MAKAQGCRLLNDFQVIKLLGAGAYGAVLQCTQKLENKDYAVKLIFSATSSAKVEIANLTKIPAHKNLTQYVTCWNDMATRMEFMMVEKLLSSSGNNFPIPKGNISLLCIQMELCGQDLRKWLGKQISVDEDKSINIFMQLVEGVEHIHGNNIIHRDLKPENIFFSLADPNHVKIGDFGTATSHSDTKSSLHSLKGTVLYFAPEQHTGKYGKSIDIYALGIIFFELLSPQIQPSKTGGTFDALFHSVEQLKDNQIIPTQIRSNWPVAVDVICQMIDRNPNKRPTLSQIYKIFSTGNLLSSTSSGVYSMPSSSSGSGKGKRSPSIFSLRKVVHVGISCSECKIENIVGLRYDCLLYNNYKLCEICQAKLGLYPADHLLQRVNIFSMKEAMRKFGLPFDSKLGAEYVAEDTEHLKAILNKCHDGSSIQLKAIVYHGPFTMYKNAIKIKGKGDKTIIRGSVKEVNLTIVGDGCTLSNLTIATVSKSGIVLKGCQNFIEKVKIIGGLNGLEIEGNKNKVSNFHCQESNFGLSLIGEGNSVTNSSIKESHIGFQINGDKNEIFKSTSSKSDIGFWIEGQHNSINKLTCSMIFVEGDGNIVDNLKQEYFESMSTNFPTDVFLFLKGSDNKVSNVDFSVSKKLKQKSIFVWGDFNNVRELIGNSLFLCGKEIIAEECKARFCNTYETSKIVLKANKFKNSTSIYKDHQVEFDALKKWLKENKLDALIQFSKNQL